MTLRSSRHRALLLIAAVVAACADGSTTDTIEPPPDPSGPVIGADVLAESAARVDVRSTGNRWVVGAGALTRTEPAVAELQDGRSARWVLPSETGWVVVLDDGSSVDVSATGDEVTQRDPADTFDPTAGPPILVGGVPVDLGEVRTRFIDPLPDTRIVTDGEVLVALGGPTDRYPHGVVGDLIEASTIEVATADGAVTTIVTLDAPDVFEAVSPMLADIDDDGDLDVLATISDSTSGARIAAYDLDGTLLAETPAIGTGNRWRNLMAVAPTGPDGGVEVIDVQTPHIGGIVQFFRFDGTGVLAREAAIRDYSTHSIGSRNLDMGIVTDADGDGQLDVLVPTQDMRSLAVLTRTDSADDGLSEISRLDLGGRLSTNIATAADGASVAYAIGTDDGRIVIWPAG